MSRAPISAVPLLGECPERLADRVPELRFAGTRGFEAMQHRWPVENPDAYPLVAHRDPDGIPHPLVERNVETVAASAPWRCAPSSPSTLRSSRPTTPSPRSASRTSTTAFNEGRRRKDVAGDGAGRRDGRGRPRPRPAGLGLPLARSPGGRVPGRYRRRASAAPADPRCGSRPARGHRCSRYAAAVGNGRARGRPDGRPGGRSLPAPDSRPGDGADDDPAARPWRAIPSPWPCSSKSLPVGCGPTRPAVPSRVSVCACPYTLGHRAAWGDASALGLTVGEYQPDGSAAAELRRVVEWLTLLVAQPQLPEASDVEVRT